LTLGLTQDQALQQLSVQHGYHVQDMQQSLQNAIDEQNNAAKNQSVRDAVLGAQRIAEIHDQQKGLALNALGSAVLNAESPEEVQAAVASMRRLGYEPSQDMIDGWTAGAQEKQDRYSSDFNLKKSEADSLAGYRKAMGDKAGQMGSYYEQRGANLGSSAPAVAKAQQAIAGLQAQINQAQVGIKTMNPWQATQAAGRISNLKAQLAKKQGELQFLQSQGQQGGNTPYIGPSGPIGNGGDVIDLGGGVIARKTG
jgi:hypothetical protein